MKLESANPTGSCNDRMAVSVLGKAMDRGDINPGDTVVEYTGGSTRTSLDFVSTVWALKFVAVFSYAFSKSKQQSMGAISMLETSFIVRPTITDYIAESLRDS